jgi:hypothetical protein
MNFSFSAMAECYRWGFCVTGTVIVAAVLFAITFAVQSLTQNLPAANNITQTQ